MSPPWSVRFEDRAPLGLIAMLRGEAWVIPDDGRAVRLDPGAVAIMKGPQGFTVADDPQTPAQVVIHPQQRVTTSGGDDLGEAMNLGVRTWATRPHGSAISVDRLLSRCVARSAQRLLDAMPMLSVLTPDTWDSPLVRLLDDEVVRDEPGQQAVLDRLFDLLLVAVVRAWFSQPEADAPTWYRAHNDPVIGRAVRMLHEPAHPWTVAGLATAAGLTRARFARRFTDLVGEPPMTYLTSWRLALAADLLREPNTTVEAVAETGRLQQRLRSQHRIQTRPRHQPHRDRRTIS